MKKRSGNTLDHRGPRPAHANRAEHVFSLRDGHDAAMIASRLGGS